MAKYKIEESVNFMPRGRVVELPNDKIDAEALEELEAMGYVSKATAKDAKAQEQRDEEEKERKKQIAREVQGLEAEEPLPGQTAEEAKEEAEDKGADVESGTEGNPEGAPKRKRARRGRKKA